jgi:Domain of unknown function (DUF4114)
MHIRTFLALTLLAFPILGHGKTDIYEPYKNINLWTADTLYLGAGFTRLSNAPVKIWLKGEEAGLDGELSFLDPITGNPITLFANHSKPGDVLILSDMVTIPLGTNLTFMYKVVGKGKWDKDLDSEVLKPKYTGPNHKHSKYVTPVSSDDNVDPAHRYGHRWSVAGRVDAKTLEFGFEDNTENDSDMDFDDIVFQLEGLNLAIFEKSAKKRYYVW